MFYDLYEDISALPEVVAFATGGIYPIIAKNSTERQDFIVISPISTPGGLQALSGEMVLDKMTVQVDLYTYSDQFLETLEDLSTVLLTRYHGFKEELNGTTKVGNIHVQERKYLTDAADPELMRCSMTFEVIK